MKFWRITCIGCLVLGMLSGCKPDAANTAAALPVTTATPASDAEVAVPIGGYVMEVFALGYPFRGEPSTEWERFETVAFDSAHHELDHITYYGATKTTWHHVFDGQGHETSARFRTENLDDATDFTSKWNADFTEQEIEEFSVQESRVVGREIRVFDKQGRLLSDQREDMHVMDYPQKSKLQMVFDGEGRRIEEREWVMGKEIVGVRYGYNDAGKCIKIEHMDGDGKPSQIEYYDYDSKGRKQIRHFEDLGAYTSSKQLNRKYEYDTNDSLEKELHYQGQCDAAGEQSGKCLVSETITYTYDAQGRLLTETCEKGQPKAQTKRKRMEYQD